MSQNITAHFVQQYTTNLQLLLQQKGSRLRSAVMEQTHVGKQAVAVDQVGLTNAAKRVGRYQPLTPLDIPTDRRWVFPNDYDWNELIDNFDKLRLLVDPQSAYVQSAIYALGRSIDDEIITAFFGTAKTGENGSTSTTFPASQEVSNDVGGTDTDLNLAKLKKAREILMANEVDPDEQLFVAITAKQHTALLNETQAVSLDYTNRPALVDGKITAFMGFNFIHTERLSITASDRSVPAWAKSGMHLGLWGDVRTDVRQRADLSSLPWQVYAEGTFGATRTEEKKVVKIICREV